MACPFSYQGDVMSLSSAERVLKHHPRPPAYLDALIACLRECLACIASCNGCGDACLHEEAAKMIDCIRTCFDCAQVCSSTAALLARLDSHAPALLRAQVQACREACRACGAECAKHDHEHCAACAECCRACEEACASLLTALA